MSIGVKGIWGSVLLVALCLVLVLLYSFLYSAHVSTVFSSLALLHHLHGNRGPGSRLITMTTQVKYIHHPFDQSKKSFYLISKKGLSHAD